MHQINVEFYQLFEAAESIFIEGAESLTAAKSVLSRERIAWLFKQAVVTDREAVEEAVLTKRTKKFDHRLGPHALPAEIEIDEILWVLN